LKKEIKGGIPLSKIMRDKIVIQGIVQGVGFRPFIYKLASAHNIAGSIINNEEGVLIEAEGLFSDVKNFEKAILQEAPTLSYIEQFAISTLPVKGDTEFVIQKSVVSMSHNVYISPDVSTCHACLEEMNQPQHRRYQYSFNNCTNCGPRFTITQNIPYDRKNTTMSTFQMCNACQDEYLNPENRRFHAQPISCYHCGPEFTVVDSSKNEIASNSPIKYIRTQLKIGKIVAIKGIGGFHICCVANHSDVVQELRNRKHRDQKPFALMMKNISVVKEFCKVNMAEENLLTGIQSPIVLLEKKPQMSLPSELSSDHHRLGVMLPYTPLHHLLFQDGLDVLVMTSGNISGEPIHYKNKDAMKGLEEIVDVYLFHNRDIYIRTDDSVTSVFKNKEYLIRRSRGYVPMPLQLPIIGSSQTQDQPEPIILACGSELKNTFTITKKRSAFISHHIGDLENFETLVSYEEGIEHFKKILKVEPSTIVCDKHPDYLSSKYAHDQNLPLIEVQHHHAHMASCMAENKLNEPVIGIVLDGTGYGDDHHIWGGEVFTGSYEHFERQAHLDYVAMPGGSAAIKEPWRMALSHLYHLYGEDILQDGFPLLRQIDSNKKQFALKMISSNYNSPLTSSAGRLFDAISSLLGLCQRIEYEGQAAIRLEKSVNPSITDVYPTGQLIQRERFPIVVNITKLFEFICEDVIQSVSMDVVAAKFHNTFAKIFVEVCDTLRTKHDIQKVVLSGGVFQNFTLLYQLSEQLNEQGFFVFTHSKVPTNDGGISYGQAAIAHAIYHHESNT
jgi:hydrogenase maturation protein HypF